jgi:bifunctional DNA-binding transcriptional regulator/antitoxin component of YhaV-PrlF toxin-antitoxin module
LEGALNGRDNIKILQVHLEILDLSKELRKIVRDLQVEIPQEMRVKFWMNVGDRVVERTDTIISELATLEIDVTELRVIHSKAENDLEKAQDEFNAGNLEEAIDALKDLKTDFIELRDAYEELVFGGVLSGDTKVKVESTSAVLSDTIKDMEESI